MSIITIIEEIEVNNYLELEELVYSLTTNTNIFKKNHKDYSVSIEQDILNNKVKVKGCFLQEHVN